MNQFEVMILVFLALVAVAGVVYYKLKQASQRIEAMFEEAETDRRRVEAARIIETTRRVAREAAAEKKAAFARSNSGYIQPTRSTSQSVARTYTSSPTPIVVDNSGNDLLTAMILQRAIDSQNDTIAGTVQWNTDVPTITETPVETYRSAEPERSSYSSSYSSSSSDSSSSSSDSASSDSYSSD